MSHSHIPNGCYSVKNAAEKLGIKPDSLLKKMRWHEWLYKGVFKNDPLKDMPLQTAIDKGFVKKVKRNSPAPYDWEIAVTQTGLIELGAKMQDLTQTQPPKPAALTLANTQKAQATNTPTAANEEREKCIKELTAMGLYFSKAS